MINRNFSTETKIVGVTKENKAHKPIQELLSKMNPGERLIFIRDYGNEYDENAIMVYNREGHHIGYISATLAGEISPFLDVNSEFNLEGIVREITGGTDGKSYGCNIGIWVQDPKEPSYEEVQAFAKSYSTGNTDNNYFSHSNRQVSKTKKFNFVTFFSTIGFGLAAFGIIYFFAFILPIFIDNDKPNTNTNISDSLITLNEYNQLCVGMTRTEIYDIVGSFGTQVSEAGQIGDDYHIVTYEYEGYGKAGANAQLMFINGELDTFAQYGLEYYYDTTDNNESENSGSFSLIKPEAESPVRISDLIFDITILPPNSIGTVYLESTYTNNSNYAITYLSLDVLLKDENDTTYLTCVDTVLPGEKSTKFNSFGPKTQLKSDFEFLKCDITIVDNNGDKTFITYDYKLNTYKVL